MEEAQLTSQEYSLAYINNTYFLKHKLLVFIKSCGTGIDAAVKLIDALYISMTASLLCDMEHVPHGAGGVPVFFPSLYSTTASHE